MEQNIWLFYVKFIWEGIYETEKKEIYYEKTTLHGMRIAYHCDDDRDSTGGIRQQLFQWDIFDLLPVIVPIRDTFYKFCDIKAHFATSKNIAANLR